MMVLKRIFCFMLCAALAAALFFPVSAARVSADEAIGTLSTLGLLRGTENGFEPERAATRAEAAVMLLRLLGLERAGEEAGLQSGFADGGWADVYLAYAKREGLLRGMSETWFGSALNVSARDWATMNLRALGYTEGADFTWSDSLSFSDRIGLTHGEYGSDSEFLREDMALMSYTALTLPDAHGRRFIETLYLRGAVSAEALKQTRFAGAVNAGKQVYSARDLYERSVSAVLYVESFEDAEAMAAGNVGGRASGFFITPDGVALMSWHQLDGFRCVRAYTADGRGFDLSEVLFYDTQRDVAVVRIRMTDTEGRSVRRFPWLELADSDALEPGDPVYTISGPLGKRDCISDGLIASPCRPVDDPAYPYIHVTAPIAPGSSGGVLLNAYGEALGVIYASYTEGQTLNLAVPVNAIRSVDLSAAGEALPEIVERVETMKAEAVLWSEQTEFSLAVGEEVCILICNDCPGQASMHYVTDGQEVVSCRWGEFQTKQSVTLYVRGVEPGESTVRIGFAPDSGNQDAILLLNFTVEEP